MSRKSEAIKIWLNDPVTSWLLKNITQRFGSYNDDWMHAKDFNDIAKCKGRKEVLDFIYDCLKDPESHD